MDIKFPHNIYMSHILRSGILYLFPLITEMDSVVDN